jgi:hypothetical protein
MWLGSSKHTIRESERLFQRFLKKIQQARRESQKTRTEI